MVLYCLLSARPTTAQDLVVAANGHLEVGISRERGNLRKLVDLSTGRNLVGPADAGLWELELIESGEPRRLSPAQAGSFHCEPMAGEPPALRLTWGDFATGSAPGLRVTAAVTLKPQASLSRWTMQVEGLGAARLDRVRFPRLLNLVEQEHERLAVPVWMGQETAAARAVFNGPAGSARRRDWSYPGELSLQCLAFYSTSGTGLYLACDDAAAYAKSAAFFGDGHGQLNCEWVHLPESTASSNGQWTMPYGVWLGAFVGDWQTAAEQYRLWATNQVWARQSRLALGQVPDWILNTGLWVWNRGRSEQVLGPATVLHQQSGLPVSVFWHWWHGCAYDSGFPEYLPPREGAERFGRALADAHGRGIRALVYMNQRLWGVTTASWGAEQARRYAVKGANGQLHIEIPNTFTRAPCSPMCMGTAFWRNKYAGLAEQATTELGIDGIYMDQACASLACYDSNHGHPVGGGNYWINGFRQLSEDIRQRRDGAPPAFPISRKNRLGRTGAPRVVLAGEGCGEPWLPYLDLMLSLQVSKERYAAPDGWETIPFFPAVYHPFAIAFGNYSSLTLPPYDDLWPAEFAPTRPLALLDRKFSRQFRLEQARAFVWGQQPTIANFRPAQLQERAEEIAYAVQLARLRQRAAKYLLHGVWLRAPELNVPEEVLDLSRLSIYAGQQEGLKTFKKRFPLALAGAWRASDGSTAIAVASIADEPLQLTLKLDREYYQISPRTRFYCLDSKGQSRRPVDQTNPREVSIPLVIESACVLQFGVRL